MGSWQERRGARNRARAPLECPPARARGRAGARGISSCAVAPPLRRHRPPKENRNAPLPLTRPLISGTPGQPGGRRVLPARRVSCLHIRYKYRERSVIVGPELCAPPAREPGPPAAGEKLHRRTHPRVQSHGPPPRALRPVAAGPRLPPRARRRAQTAGRRARKREQDGERAPLARRPRRPAAPGGGGAPAGAPQQLPHCAVGALPSQLLAPRAGPAVPGSHAGAGDPSQRIVPHSTHTTVQHRTVPYRSAQHLPICRPPPGLFIGGRTPVFRRPPFELSLAKARSSQRLTFRHHSPARYAERRARREGSAARRTRAGARRTCGRFCNSGLDNCFKWRPSSRHAVNSQQCWLPGTRPSALGRHALLLFQLFHAVCAA